MNDVTLVKLRRPWFFGGTLYKPNPSGTSIIGLNAYAAEQAEVVEGDKKRKVTVEDILPSGATVITEPTTPLPLTHPTVTTLSELSKRPAPSPVEAVTASKGPEVIVDDTVEKPGQPAPAKVESKK